jgi:hypothetical protein
MGWTQVEVAVSRVKSVGQVEQELMELPEQVEHVVSHLAQYEPVP